MRSFFYRIIFMLLVLLPGGIYAQTTDAAKPAESPQNAAQILMVSVIIVLLFVIWGLGQVLISAGRQMMDKSRNKTALMIVILCASMLASFPASAQDAPVQAAAVNYAGMSSTSFWLMVSIIIVEITVICFMLFSIRRLMAELLPPKPVREYRALKNWWAMIDKKFFTRAVPVEKEADVMLDHDYDGIRELDNALPPWWKYGFIITIFIAVIYMLNFHVIGSGKNPTEEYQQEMADAAIAKELYEAANKDRVDENNIQMPAAGGLAEAKDIFTSVCAACHGQQGEGGAGPNLTDAYWLHKGSLADVYFSIKHGYPDKGMQAWEKNYSPKQINNLAGYIKTLGGTNPPNPKGPQGDLFEEAPKKDSNSVAHK